MNKSNLDLKSQRIARAGRITKLSHRRIKSGDTVIKVDAAHMSMKGQPLKVKVSDIVKALDEVENATTVRDVLSSASKAKTLLKKYRDSQKMCE
jgi:hypothetical protein